MQKILRSTLVVGLTFILSGFLAAAGGGEEDTGFTPEQEYLFKVFKSRRSVRDFLPTPVPDSHLKRILDVARSAPTSGNQQPWKFLIVRDAEKIAALKQALVARGMERLKMPSMSTDSLEVRTEKMKKYFDRIMSAPVYVVVLVDRRSQYPSYNRHDGPLAAGYLMIAARALGYGTVFFTDSIPEQVTREVLKIPKRYERICITPIGVPKEWPKGPAKDPLESFIVYDTFSKKGKIDK